MILLPRLLQTYRNRVSIGTAAFLSTMSPAPPSTITPLPRSLYPDTITYTPEDLRTRDETSDEEWYARPRFVQHIDEGAVSLLKQYYGHIIKPNYSVVDLCSSWVSHLPDELKVHNMVGYGMNKAELEKNEHLGKFFVKDLNADPSLKEVPDEAADVVICSVSVDYLTKPVEVFKEVNRVLKVGGTAHMAFSNRCFPTKVVGKWTGLSDEERRRWVGGYFWASGGWEEVEDVVLKEKGGLWGSGGDPLFVVRAKKAGRMAAT